MNPADIPLSLYVHIPWCVRKCPYCDFNSHEAEEFDEAAYVRALIDDFEMHREDIAGRPLTSVFFGGGTPSLFSPASIEQILVGVSGVAQMTPDAEITLEANPGTVSEGSDRFRGFRTAGINRISLGVQSFNPGHLSSLGRIHSSEEAKRAYDFVRGAGFDNVNLDLMHGLPGQSVDDAMNDLANAILLGPEHISWYQLTIEPNTVFYKRPPILPDDDTLWDIYDAGTGKLEDAGYDRYEVSAFASVGRQSRHNLNYWKFGDYIGIGAGAHGKVSGHYGIDRTSKTRMPNDYMKSPGTKKHGIAMSELPLEFMMNALRLIEGIEMELFEARTGLDPSVVHEFLVEAEQQGFIVENKGRIIPTALGTNHLNSLLVRLQPGDIISRS